jgi:hypothetical protein
LLLSTTAAYRYYSSSERMTTLLTKVSNQIIRRCKEHIIAPGKIWDQNVPQLIVNMQARTQCHPDAPVHVHRLKHGSVCPE